MVSRIFVITHKIFEDEFLEKYKEYSILHVGMNDNIKDGYLIDTLGDSISLKNKSFCELTGMYWFWKNYDLSKLQYIGLVHYRRYFLLPNTKNNWKTGLVDNEYIKKQLFKYDIILPKGKYSYRNMIDSYAFLHNVEDLNYTRQIIMQKYPDYLKDYDRVMQGHKYYYGNMFIMKIEDFKLYCDWLFSIMNDLECIIGLNKYEDIYQNRVYGFIAERLIQIWVVHNKLKICELNVYNPEEKKEKIVDRIKRRIAIERKNV